MKKEQLGKHTIQCFGRVTYHTYVFNMVYARGVWVQSHAFLIQAWVRFLTCVVEGEETSLIKFYLEDSL